MISYEEHIELEYGAEERNNVIWNKRTNTKENTK
jgi:hypothetical protein